MRYRPFWNRDTEWPSNHTKYHKVTGILCMFYLCRFCSTTSSSSQKSCWDKCTNWPQNCFSALSFLILVSCTLQWTVFKLQAIFLRQVHWTTPKWPQTLWGQKYQLHVPCSKSQISPLFALHPAIFELQTFLRGEHWITPKWPQNLNTKRSMKFYVHSTSHKSWVTNFTPFCSMASWFQVTSHFMRTLYWMTPKWPWILQGEGYSLYGVLLVVTLVPKFQSILLYGQHNELQAILRQVHQITIKRP